ncbi:CHAD domain-containing protein [Undibacterium sp. TJN25]|uniref:CYTH and CHAD domain-containing protein n=1 Tax=Undibacterium sp. TJN25 TaxID=3413056 RepID=UPI003BEFF40D
METELKLSIHIRHAGILRKHPLLKEYAVRNPRRQQMSDTYFDTPDLHLWRSKFGLRVRQTGKRWIQTLKGGGSAAGGLHQRHEWESALDGPLPDLAALQKRVAGEKAWAVLLQCAGKNIQPVFTTQITRTVWDLRLPTGEEVEFVLDQGYVQSGDRRKDISEIELELKSGKAVHLFELALQLQKKIPLRICDISKAQRGYILYLSQQAQPQAPSAVKASELVLRKKMDAEQAFRVILGNCVAQIQGNEAGVADSDAPESLHQMRVGLRRLRSAFGLYKDIVIVPKQVEEDMEWLSGQLGAARDWDVLAHSTLAAVAEAADIMPAGVQLAPLQAAALAEAGKKHEAAAVAVRSPRFARLVLNLSARAHGAGWNDPGREDVQQELDKRIIKFAGRKMEQAQRRLYKCGKRGKQVHATDVVAQGPTGESGHGMQAEVHARHRLRIASKKLRYTAEFFHSLFPSRRMRLYMEAMTGLQEILGQCNDVVVASGLLGQLQQAHAELGVPVGFARGCLAARAEHAIAAMEKQWRHLETIELPGKS